MCVYVCVCVCVPALLRLQNLFCCNALLRGAPPHPPTPHQRPSVLWERIRAWTLLSMLDLPASGNRPFVLNNSTFTSRVGGVLRGRGGEAGSTWRPQGQRSG